MRRVYRNGRVKCTKTEASVRAVPLQAVALAALAQLPADTSSALLFPTARGGHLDLHNFRNRDWKPAQRAAGITPLRRVYDLRHTFATLRPRGGRCVDAEVVCRRPPRKRKHRLSRRKPEAL